MDVFEAIKTRLTVREFKADPVPDEVVNRMLLAAQWSPSSRNLQPWHFIVIRESQTLQTIGRIATSGRFVSNAPMAIAIAMDNADRPDLDAGRVLQQIELVAWEEGLGTCFVGLGVAEQNQQVKEVLGIPDHMELITVLPFGYRRDNVKGIGTKRRKSLDEIVHYESF